MLLFCCRGTSGPPVVGAWNESGGTLGVALDMNTGTLLVSVDGAAWAVAFADGCAPGAAVGAALFPALCGSGGARVRCNWGADAGRPMRHSPPSWQYNAVGLAEKVPFSPLPLSSLPTCPKRIQTLSKADLFVHFLLMNLRARGHVGSSGVRVYLC